MHSKGLLYIISSDTCGVCLHRKETGYFDTLVHNLKVDDIAYLDLENEDIVPSTQDGHEVLNIDRRLPSFKFMSVETCDNLKYMSKEEALDKIRFFNGVVVNGSLRQTYEYKSLDIEEIQRFCDDSAKMILKEAPVKPLVVGPTPRFRSTYTTM